MKEIKTDNIKISIKDIIELDSFVYEGYPLPSEVKENSGVYIITGFDNEILYIGKAKNLRNRLCSHLSPNKKIGISSWIPLNEVVKVFYLYCDYPICEIIEAAYQYFYDSKYNNCGLASDYYWRNGN
jgi:hypothetical protein